jgi:hypothetical protein
MARCISMCSASLGSGGVFTMNVWSTDSPLTIACSLTNGTAFTGHGSERQTISVNCPGGAKPQL